jgi:folate-dependent phosphoribosylglycinamide formyltransferase PurN
VIPFAFATGRVKKAMSCTFTGREVGYTEGAGSMRHYGNGRKDRRPVMEHSFLIITTNNLPEAYFVVDFLLRKGQRVAVVNKRGRTLRENVQVLGRLTKRRGPFYLADMLLGKLFRRAYIAPAVLPFPEIGEGKIQQLIGQVDYHECDDVHEPSTIEWIGHYAPDYILIAGAPVLERKVFSLAKKETLNRHQGISPKYRGSDCPIWVLASGKTGDLGYTIHTVSERVDGGAILAQKQLAIPGNLDFSEALAYVNRQASIGYTDVLGQIIEGKPVAAQTQQRGEGRHYPPATLTAIRKARKHYREAAALNRLPEAE